jgi:DNA invertase Pin-like site-specific DNA recombinase
MVRALLRELLQVDVLDPLAEDRDPVFGELEEHYVDVCGALPYNEVREDRAMNRAESTVSPLTIAYSYIRFSHPSQAEGDSLRRQTEYAAAYCGRRGWQLDTSLTLFDLGVSAFRGKNAAVGCLRTFLDAVEFGRVLPGSALIVENIDRISRQGIDEGYDLIKKILKAGVRIVTLSPEREYDRESVRKLTSGALELQLYLERAAEESERKSVRVGEAWGQKRKAARKNGTVETTRVPAWLEVIGRERIGKHARGGSFRILPKRASVVRLLFKLANSGHGLSLIVKRLTAKKVPTWGRGHKWSKAYVRKILTGRAVLGEYQPKKHGKAEGAPVKDYYPAVVDEKEWDRAQGALASRRDKPGRVGRKSVSLFSGLLWDARSQERLLIAWQTQGSGKARRKVRALVPAGSLDGRAKAVTFNYAIFETAVLSFLKEIKVADVVGKEVATESAAIELELADIRQKRARLVARIVAGADLPELEEASRQLHDREAALQKELASARQKEANPQGAAWQEAQTLIDVAADEAGFLRLRGLVRTIVDKIWVLVEVRGADRLAWVQLNFAAGGCRHYLIRYRTGGFNREGFWQAKSFRADDFTGRTMMEVDLADKHCADCMGGELQSMLDDIDVIFRKYEKRPTAKP